MTIGERVDKLEKFFGAQDAMVKELRDAVTVIAQLEACHGRLLRERSEWLVAHDRAMRERDERMKALDERISKLASGVGEFVRRQA